MATSLPPSQTASSGAAASAAAAAAAAAAATTTTTGSGGARRIDGAAFWTRLARLADAWLASLDGQRRLGKGGKGGEGGGEGGKGGGGEGSGGEGEGEGGHRRRHHFHGDDGEKDDDDDDEEDGAPATELFGRADALAFCAGAFDARRAEDALQLWLLGGELPDTLLLVVRTAFAPSAPAAAAGADAARAGSTCTVHAVVANEASARALRPLGAALEQLRERLPQAPAAVLFPTPESFRVHDLDTTGQTAEAAAAAWTALLTQHVESPVRAARAEASGGPGGAVRVGTQRKARPAGPFAAGWLQALKDAGAAVEAVEVRHGVARVVAVKDASEIKNIRAAAIITDLVFRSHLTDEVEGIIDEERTVSHQEVAERVAQLAAHPEQINKKLAARDVDVCYPPLVQSGSDCTLQPGGPSDTQPLQYGSGTTIVLSLGFRYRLYCANVARTLLIEPTPFQRRAYQSLFNLQQKLVKMARPGVVLRELHEEAQSYLRRAESSLLPHLSPTCGASIGVVFSEGAYALNATNPRRLRAGMALNIAVGLENVPNPDRVDARAFSVLLADTVLIGLDGKTDILTAKTPKEFSEVTYHLTEQQQQQQRQPAGAGSARGRGAAGAAGGGAGLSAAGAAAAAAAAGGGGGGGPGGAGAGDSRKRARARGDDYGGGGDDDGDHDDDDDSGGDDSAGEGGGAGYGPTIDPRNVVTTRLREQSHRLQDKQHAAAAEDKRRKHQSELAEQIRLAASERFGRRRREPTADVRVRELRTYRSHEEFPRDVKRLRIHVDTHREAVILPIHGQMVPFHVSTIKNCSRTDDGERLRINLVTPVGAAGTVPSSSSIPTGLVFVKELVYKHHDAMRLQEIERSFKLLRRRMLERHETASIVQQPDLQLITAGKFPRLTDVFVRPAPTSRKAFGVLEAHVNGFRFRPQKRQLPPIDIIYTNIRHAFFQPAERDALVVVHFNLWKEIMVGTKKTGDVQFCVEVLEAVQDLAKMRYDRDEMEEEQREAALRMRENRRFQAFCQGLQGMEEDSSRGRPAREGFRPFVESGLEFDQPYRTLEFFGVPHRATVRLLPSVACLVNLSEMPFFCLTMADVEIASLERVSFSLRNFDIIFVLKDYEKPPVEIGSVPRDSLESVKQWLDMMETKFYESSQKYSWGEILREVRKDPRKFHLEDGGWDFLEAEEGSSSGEAQPGGDDVWEESEYSSAEESDDEYDEGSAVSEEEEEDEEYDDEEDEDGESWEVMEEKARRDDARKRAKGRGRGGDSD